MLRQKIWDDKGQLLTLCKCGVEEHRKMYGYRETICVGSAWCETSCPKQAKKFAGYIFCDGKRLI